MKKDMKNIIIAVVAIVVSGVLLYTIPIAKDLWEIQHLGNELIKEQYRDEIKNNRTTNNGTPVEDDGTTHNITNDGSKYDILSDEQKQVVEIIESALIMMESGDSDTIPVAYQGAIGDETFSFNINRYFREHYEAKGLGVVRMEDECDSNGIFQVYLTKY
jgi:hypothetical protein